MGHKPGALTATCGNSRALDPRQTSRSTDPGRTVSHRRSSRLGLPFVTWQPRRRRRHQPSNRCSAPLVASLELW